MVNLREFIISEKTFWGFKTHIDMDKVDTLDQIVQEVINNLRKILIDNNLIVLKETLDGEKEHPSLNWHIHNSNLEEILTTNNEIYVCSH